MSLLSNPDGQEGLLRHMDEVIAELPLDFENYEGKVQILTDLHGYIEGTYTIFPERKKEEIRIENGGQLSLFDFMGSSEPEPKPEPAKTKEQKGTKEKPEKKEPEAGGKKEELAEKVAEQAAEDGGRSETGRYGYDVGSFIYLDTDHLYRISGVRNQWVFVRDMEDINHKESMISLESYDGRLSVCPGLNRHMLIGGNATERDSRTVYKECLYTALDIVRNSAVYDVIRSRDVDADMAYDIVQEELDN